MEAISESCRVFTHFLHTQLPRCHTLLLFGFPLLAWYCVFFSVAAAAQHRIGSCAVWVAPVVVQPRASPPGAGQSQRATSVGCSIPTPAEHHSRPGAACCPTSSPPLTTAFPQCSCPATVPHAPVWPSARAGGGTGGGLLHRCLFIKRKGTAPSTSLTPITYSACLPGLYSYKHAYAQL